MREQQESEYNLYMIGKFDIPSALSQLMERSPAGFAVALHIRYQSPALLFQTYPVAWLEEYSRDGLLMHDPTVAWALAERGVVRWDDLAGRDPAGVLGRARGHGLVHGFTISLKREGSLSIAGFARADRPFEATEIAGIGALVGRLHDATAPGAPLAPETREALRRLSVAFTQPGLRKTPGPATGPC
ncbi:MAG TPA: autoinducer binding domain-containing protein [Rubellimicrobium sp.]|nr:autoinducer binding domain-containing protein [Rubellimicrobium sp.]